MQTDWLCSTGRGGVNYKLMYYFAIYRICDQRRLGLRPSLLATQSKECR